MILKKVKDKELLFLSVYRFYWIIFFPSLLLIDYFFQKTLFEEHAGVLLFFFSLCAAVVVFFIQMLRAMYADYKNKPGKQRVWLVLFAIWAWIFVVWVGLRTVLLASSYFSGQIPLLWIFDLFFYLEVLLGEYLIIKMKRNRGSGPA